jgi:hypothetical protein
MDNLLIRTCLEIVEGGQTFKMHEVHNQLFEIYHTRMENTTAHRRPDDLLHPQKLLECTAFKTQREWDAWKVAAKFGSGKVVASDGNAGLLSEAHSAWAHKKWEKYKLLKREIHDQTQRLWSALVPNNALPSGSQKINDIVEKLRKQLFDVWKFAKTSAKSKTKYANQEMTGACADYRPTWWMVWKAMGPASGMNCSATFMSEVGMRPIGPTEPVPSLLQEHFDHQTRLAIGAANFMLKSKKDIKKENDAKKANEQGRPITPVIIDNDFAQSRSRTMDAKVQLDIRRQEIQRLQFLVESAFATHTQKLEWGRQLFAYMQSPVSESSFASFMIKPEVLPCVLSYDSQVDEPSSDLQIQDAAAIPFVRTQTPDRVRVLDPLLLPEALPAVHAPLFVDFEAVEKAAMRGDMLLPPSCPVDMDQFDFVTSMFSADLPTPDHPVLKPCNTLKLSTVHPGGSSGSGGGDDGKNIKLAVHPAPSDGSCCPASILAAWWHLRVLDASFMKNFNMDDTALALRQSTVNYIKKHSDKACPSLGSQTFRDGIAFDYLDGDRELRDSDFYREAMEAGEDPKQVLNSFTSYITAMRKPHAYADEFFVAAAAMHLEAQICVIREAAGGWMPTFYQHPVSKFRLILLSRNDHFEWCTLYIPGVSVLPQELIEVNWNPPSLETADVPELIDDSDDSDDEDDNDELDDCFVSVRQTEDEWFAYIENTWSVLPFPAVNSFFSALIHWLNIQRPLASGDWNEQMVRTAIAMCLENKKGFYVDQQAKVTQPFDSSGYTTLQNCDFIPGCERSACRFSLKEYCAGIASDWPPGDLEIRAAAEHFGFQFTLYEYGKEPVKFCDNAVRNNLLSTRMIRRAIISDEPTVRFRYFLITERQPARPFFYQHAKLMQNLPQWNVDLGVVHISDEVGRGIVAMRPFKKNETVGTYDGHRCDLTGKLVIPRKAISDLFLLHPQLNRHVSNGKNFRESHSVTLKRSHESGLLIDGWPLCDPILDSDVNSLGRFALANSASSHCTANIKMMWVPAPDLPNDPVNRIADCECILVCTRDVEVGEELLWNYPIQHHITYLKMGSTYDSQNKSKKGIVKKNTNAHWTATAAKRAARNAAQKSAQAQAAADIAILQAAAAATVAAARAADALAAAVPATAAPKKAAAAIVAAARAADALAAAVLAAAPKKAAAATVAVARAADALAAAVPATAAPKKAAAATVAAKRSDSATDGGLDPDCLCPGETKCKLGSCWFYGGRLQLSRRRIHES